jgi:hypothetical protein
MKWIFALLLMCSSALAQEQCFPVEQVVTGIAAQRPVKKMVVLTTEQVARVIAWVNSIPPETEWDYNFAVLLEHADGIFVLMLGHDRTVCRANAVKPEYLRDLFEAIEGGRESALPIILVQDGPAVHHHDGMSAEVDRFYSSWLVPNGGNPRLSSCCSKTDCSPAEIRRVAGHWEGRRLRDSLWVTIPEKLIESNQGDPRESPDGLSHLCLNGSGAVLCAVLGSGQ